MQIVKRNVFTLFNFLNLTIALLLFAVGAVFQYVFYYHCHFKCGDRYGTGIKSKETGG